MKIYSINNINQNSYTIHKSLKCADKNVYAGKTDYNTISACYTYLPNNTNFKGREWKTLGRREFRELTKDVTNRAKKYGIIFKADTLAPEVFDYDYVLELADYFLKHKIIENDGVRQAFNYICSQVALSSDKNRNQPSCEHTYDMDYSLLKSNCEAIMDFADFIVEHPIYSNSEVQRIMGTVLEMIRADNIEKKKVMANYLALNPDKLEDSWAIWDGLVSGDGYDKHLSYDDDFNPKELAKPLDSNTTLEIPEENLLPVSSVVCTLDDINNYLTEHFSEIDKGRIFNKPVTKDGESLLIALTKILPDDNNIDAYIKLVNNMIKLTHIEYNQKDTLGVPAIAHVLNSQNKILFAAFTKCNNLRYDPYLDTEFNNIKDSEFKDFVINSHIFENLENTGYEKIFGKPNPMYGK